MNPIIQMTWSLVIFMMMVMMMVSCSEFQLVETLTGEQENLCSVYPGVWTTDRTLIRSSRTVSAS